MLLGFAECLLFIILNMSLGLPRYNVCICQGTVYAAMFHRVRITKVLLVICFRKFSVCAMIASD
jgi:hypothetical protein